MVRKYRKKSSRNSWTLEDLELAKEQVRNGKSIISAAEEFNIPRTTLQKKVKLNESDQKTAGI